MATQVQFRRGTTAQTSTFTGATAEITIDTDKEVVVVHDGVTAGGYPLARESALTANVASITGAFNTANAAFTTANSAGSYANSAFLVANSAASINISDYFPTGDYGNLTDPSTSAFGELLIVVYDCRIDPITPNGFFLTKDFGLLT